MHLKAIYKFLILLCLLIVPISAQATFSIVAVDTTTGAVGGAGASCIDNSFIINSIIEGVGAVHTQAYYLSGNQYNAYNLLNAGNTPADIIDWLINNDVEGTPEYRQYGVVTLAGPGASAGFTGSANTIWREHVTEPGYSIQGNILLGPEIIAGMEAAYLATEGPLEDKLMAAMNAADVPGADTRCASCAKPSISAFIKVVHIGDGGASYLAINIPDTDCPTNPIDSLNYKFDLWKQLKVADPTVSSVTPEVDTLSATGDDTTFVTITPLNYDGGSPTEGSSVEIFNTGNGVLSAITDNGDGTFSTFVVSPTTYGHDTISVQVTAGGETIELDNKPILFYFRCGDATGDGDVNLLDVLYVISYKYDEPPGVEPQPFDSGDADGDGQINLIDILYLIDFVYGTPPGADPVCP